MASLPRITTGLPSPRQNYNSGVPLPLVPLPLKISGACAFIFGITGILLFYSSLPKLSYDPRNEQLMTDALESSISPSRNAGLATAAICAIQKLGLRYIDEWVDYHLAIGFQTIFIYDNSDDFETLGKFACSFRATHCAYYD